MKQLIGATLGQYEIKSLIGRGGMAYVFKAYQANLDRYIALKVLPPTLAEDPDFTERFQREALAIAKLHHPNILPVYDFGIHDDYSYIAMRYVEESKTLADLMKEGAPLNQLIDYIVQVAGALNYAHSRKIVHRDVKPSNILIDGEWALLSDFGLVKMSEADKHLTSTGTSMGTPAYMAPEQVVGKGVDQRSDIYALGVILHKVLTGTIPHDAPTPIAIMHKRSHEPVPPLRQLKPDVPESLEQVVLRSLATQPDDRYTTAVDFGNALKKAREDPAYREPTLTNLQTMDATMLSRSSVGEPAAGSKNTPLLVGGGLAAVVLIALLALGVFFFSGGGETVTPTPDASPQGSGALIVSVSTDTPTPPPPTPVPPGTPSAVALARLEVRSGPGEVYDLLGYLPEGASAEIISQDESEAWWQVKTSLGGNGTGWVRAGAEFSEATDAGSIPIALAPPTPTGTPTSTSTPEPETPTSEPETPTPTATPEPETPTPTATSTPAAVAAAATTPAARPSATPTEAPAAPAGEIKLVSPLTTSSPTFGMTQFQWQYGGALGENQGFEVRVWRDGEAPAGVHNSVLDNRQGKIQALGNGAYELTADISDTPGVRKRGGEYNWTVILVELEPYKELGIQAPSARLRFDVPGGGGGGGGGGNGGGGGGGGNGGGPGL